VPLGAPEERMYFSANVNIALKNLIQFFQFVRENLKLSDVGKVRFEITVQRWLRQT
jgi:hypothetical protein